MACPCGSYITEWRVWVASGKSSLMGDSDPLNGITATCSDGYVLQVRVVAFCRSVCDVELAHGRLKTRSTASPRLARTAMSYRCVPALRPPPPNQPTNQKQNTQK